MMDDLLAFLEPVPSVRIDEAKAQKVLQRSCPVCLSSNGFSCTVPVEVDFQTKRQQVLEFHLERAEGGQS